MSFYFFSEFYNLDLIKKCTQYNKEFKSQCHITQYLSYNLKLNLSVINFSFFYISLYLLLLQNVHSSPCLYVFQCVKYLFTVPYYTCCKCFYILCCGAYEFPEIHCMENLHPHFYSFFPSWQAYWFHSKGLTEQRYNERDDGRFWARL